MTISTTTTITTTTSTTTHYATGKVNTIFLNKAVENKRVKKVLNKQREIRIEISRPNLWGLKTKRELKEKTVQTTTTRTTYNTSCVKT